jgi:hypothetical protein
MLTTLLTNYNELDALEATTPHQTTQESARDCGVLHHGVKKAESLNYTLFLHTFTPSPS